MKFIFSTNSNARLNDLWLLVFRITLSVFMLTHGWPKLMRLIEGGGADFSDPLGIGNNLSLVLAVIGEVVGPLMIIPGILTRLATIPVLSTMQTKAISFIIAGWIFSSLIILTGILNVILVHPVPGIVYLLLSAVYLPPVNSFLMEKWGFKIPLLVKIALGVFIVMFTLGVSDLAEMYGL